MKKTIYWVPRVGVLVYATLPVASAVVDSFRTGFNLVPFLMFVGLSLLGGAIAWLAWKHPKIGGVLLTALGLIVIVGASNTDIGVDWSGVVSGGIPLTIIGLLFVYEGWAGNCQKEENETKA